jgi:hypothetical protein
VNSRVRATMTGGTDADRDRLRRALEQLYNENTVTGYLDILATLRPDGRWIIEMAHLYGRGELQRVQMPRGIPNDVRLQVTKELSGLGLPIAGA